MLDTIVPRSIFSPEVKSPDDYPGGRQRKASHIRNKKWFMDNVLEITRHKLTPERVLSEVQRYYEIYDIMQKRIAAYPDV